MTEHGEERLVLYINSDLSKGKAAAAAVHAALAHYGIEHGAVIVLHSTKSKIRRDCDIIIQDAGRTEVPRGTITAGVKARQ